MTIENIEPVVTFIAGTTIGSVVGYLIRILIEHRLAKSLSANERYFAAAQRFRDTVNTAMSMFQPTHYTWTGSNKDVAAMRNFIRNIETHVVEFAEFKGTDKTGFINKWEESKNYCSQVLVHEISSGDPDRSNKSKDTFLNHVSELLSYAKPT